MAEPDLNRPLERRASAGRRDAQAPRRKTAALTANAFRQTLTKYSQRQARSGRQFALIGLTVLEYEHVKQTLGDEAADQLSNLARDICLKGTRGADRLCLARPGNILLLLPDTTAEAAAQAVDRLSQTIASNKTHYKHKPLRASCSHSIAHSATFSGDAEAMLAHVGYNIDEEGNLIGISQPTPSGLAGSVGLVGFCGAFSAWWERYDKIEAAGPPSIGEHLKVLSMKARDIWRPDRSVEIQAMELKEADTAFDTETLSGLQRRAKVLQAVDHPGVCALTDFHVKDFKTLYLVRPIVAGMALPKVLDRHPISNCATVVDWALQVCNSLIYLQSLMPPVVPPPLSTSLFMVVDSTRLVFVDYEIPYLFPKWYQGIAVSDLEMQAVAQGRPIAAYDPIVCSFGKLMGPILERLPGRMERLDHLFQCLQEKERPPQLSTVYKIRQAIKEIAESENVELSQK